MSRSVYDFTSSRSEEELKTFVDNFPLTSGFKLANVKGEMMFRKGEDIGMLPPQFIKIEINGNNVHIEAFVKTILGESQLTGIFGIAAKKPLKNTVETIMQTLK